MKPRAYTPTTRAHVEKTLGHYKNMMAMRDHSPEVKRAIQIFHLLTHELLVHVADDLGFALRDFHPEPKADP